MHSQRRDRTTHRSAIDGGNQYRSINQCGQYFGSRCARLSRTGMTRNRRGSGIAAFVRQQVPQNRQAVGQAFGSTGSPDLTCPALMRALVISRASWSSPTNRLSRMPLFHHRCANVSAVRSCVDVPELVLRRHRRAASRASPSALLAAACASARTPQRLRDPFDISPEPRSASNSRQRDWEGYAPSQCAPRGAACPIFHHCPNSS